MHKEDIEKFIIEHIDELLKECAHMCREGTYYPIELREGISYEGCDYCILASALDHINAPSITIKLRDGSSLEFVPLGDYVLEIGEGLATLISIKDLEERLISMLRNDFSVESLFLTFEKDCLYSLFSYPLIIDGENVGTISGVTVGKRNLATEEEFIRVVSS